MSTYAGPGGSSDDDGASPRRSVSRRRVVVTGAAGVVFAAAGATVAAGPGRRHRALRAIGLASGPDHHAPPSGVTVRSGSFTSRFMPHPVGWTMSAPPGRRAGIVYCLHGRGDDHHYAFDAIHLHDVAAEVDAPLIVAAVDGGHSSYWHHRLDGSDSLRMLLEEFVPLAEQDRPGLRRALMGWSMGGYGALLVAERATAKFVAVAVASPALWTSPSATAPGAFD